MSRASLARKLEDLERKFAEHGEQFLIVFEAIRQLMEPVEENTKCKVGF